MKIKYLWLSAALFTGCGASLSLHDGSSGGSDGSADSGATTTGGSSTGTSDGSVITTSSSGGSSGGSSGSSSGASTGSSSSSSAGANTTGGSTGSSTGPPPPTTHFNLINAAPNSTGALDLCVKVHGDADPAAGISGGITYTHVSAFFDVTASATVDISVVASSDTNCSTPLAQKQVDLSDTSLFYTAVIYQNGTNDLTGVTVALSPGKSPTLTSDINLGFVQAMVTTDGNAISFGSELPHNDYSTLSLGAVFPNDPLASEVTPLGAPLWAKTTAELDEFVNPSAVANAIITAVFVGNENTSAPAQLLVCNESLETPTCTSVANTPTSYLRFANLTDVSDAVTATFWVSPHALVPNFDSAIGAPLTAGKVGIFRATVAGANDFCVTTSETPPADCSAIGEYFDGNESLLNGLYTTFAFGGSPGFGFGTELALAPPEDPNSQRSTLVTTMNLLSDGTQFAANATLLAPDNFDFMVAAPTDNRHPVTVDIGGSNFDTAGLWYQLTGGPLLANFDNIEPQGFSFPTSAHFQTSSSSYTAMLGGFGQLQFCANDGRADLAATGLALCTVADAPSVTATAYLRVLNVSTAMAAGVDACSDQSTTAVISDVAIETGTGFVPVPAGTQQLAFMFGNAGCLDAGSLYEVIGFTPTAGSYTTLLFDGDSLPNLIWEDTQLPQTSPSDDSTLIEVGNAWDAGGANNNIAFSLHGTPIGEAALTGTLIAPFSDNWVLASVAGDNTIELVLSDDTGAAATGTFDYTFDPALMWTAASYSIVAYQAPGAPASDPPKLLICNDDLLSAPCVSVLANP